MFTQLPGSIVPDTKFDLYLDPLFFMQRVISGWDPGTYLGFIPHQAISYLFPMGTFFYIAKTIGIPIWIAQRLWQTLLLFVAGWGVVNLMDTLRGKPRTSLHWVAALFYMFNPYVMMWLPRTSGMLLPYVMLPWMLDFTVKGMWRPRGWKYPMLVGIAFFLMTGLNAASTIYVLAAPIIYFLYHVYVLRTSTFRTAILFAAKCLVLIALLSVWWLIPLLIQGKLALNILSFTEPAYFTNLTSSFSESLRMFGFWFFYGGDRFGPWYRGALNYLSNPLLVITTFAVPVLALVSAWLIRWRYRIYFAMLMVASVLLMVGVFPPQKPSPYGRLLNYLYDHWQPAMAFRNTYKAAPLLALSFAALLGAGVESVQKRIAETREARGLRPGWVPFVPLIVVLALTAINTYGYWTFSAWDTTMAVKGGIPQYWRDAARQINGFGMSTSQIKREEPSGTGAQQQSYRLLMFPGQTFAYYRWGVTLDDISQALIKRPMLLRTLVPYGSPYGANLTAALDGAVQQGTLEPNTLLPIARYLGAGDVLVRHDLDWARWDTPRPAVVIEMLGRQGLLPGPGGGTFGEPGQWFTTKERSVLLSQDFGFPDVEAKLHPLEYFIVPDPLPIVRADRTERPLLISGDNFSLLTLSGFGYLNENPPFFLSASQTTEQLQETLNSQPSVIITDSNRRRAWQFGVIKNNYSYTLQEGEELRRGGVPDRDWTVFDEVEAPRKETVAEFRGVKSIRASSYGSFWYELPENRPAHAFDRNLNTAWMVGGLGNPVGAQLEVVFEQPTSVQNLTISLKYEPDGRNITRLTVIPDTGREIPLDLQQTAGPQTFDLGQPIQTQRLRFRIDRISSEGKNAKFLPPVGIAEIEIPGIYPQELLRTPEDLFRRAPGGDAALAPLNLSYVFQRAKNQPGDFMRSDEEANLARVFYVPSRRDFEPRAGLSLSPATPDETVDALLGVVGPVRKASSSSRWLGMPKYRAMSAVDGDTDTFWAPAIGSKMEGESLTVELAAPTTISKFDFVFKEDEVHSGIAEATVIFDGSTERKFSFEAPPSDKLGLQRYTRSVDPPVTASSITFRVDKIREVYTADTSPVRGNPKAILMPVAVAELGIPGIQNAAPKDTDEIATPCEPVPPAPSAEKIRTEGTKAVPDTTIWVDGQQVRFRATAKVDDLLSLRTVPGEPCPGSAPIRLDKGDHTLFTSPKGALVIDRVALDSVVAPVSPVRRALPLVEVTNHGRYSWDIKVSGATEDPWYLILGENINPGWRGRIVRSDGTSVPLQPQEPKLINGYANAWLIKQPGSYTIHLEYRPQQLIYIGMAVTGITLIVCFFVLMQIWWVERARRQALLALARRGAPAGRPVGRRPGGASGSPRGARMQPAQPPQRGGPVPPGARPRAPGSAAEGDLGTGRTQPGDSTGQSLGSEGQDAGEQQGGSTSPPRNL
jgi:arabinofuranan 3-O-arabinosyltransferase